MRAVLLVPVLVCGTLVVETHAQSSDRAAPNDLFPAALFAPMPAPRTPDSDLAIVFWFDWRDPSGTLRHQVYDRRKGEYTRAVTDWREMISRHYPDYLTSVKYVDVGDRDAAVAIRETVEATRNALRDASRKILAANVSRRLQRLSEANRQARSATSAGLSRHAIGINGALGASGAVSNTGSMYPFPVPFPYPRPHP